MTRLRVLVASTAAVTVTVLALAPVALADSTVVVRDVAGNSDSPDAVGELTRTYSSCLDIFEPPTTGGEGTFFTIRPTNDPDFPLGSSKTGVDYGPSDTDAATGFIAFSPTPTTTTVLDVRAQLLDASLGGVLVAYYESPTDPSGAYWSGAAPLLLTGGPTWKTVNGVSTSLSWKHYVNGLPDGSTGSGTIPAFTTAKGGDGGGVTAGFTFGCDAADFYTDRFRFGSAGSVSTFDFERILTKTFIKATPATVVAGKRVVLTGYPEGREGSHFSVATMTLEQKPWGASSFTAVGSSTATYDDEQVPARFLATPTRQTSYRWVFDGGPSAEGSTSAVAVVRVAKAVRAVVPRTAVKGKRFSVGGTIRPGTSGVALKLQAKVKGTWRTLATGRSRAGGRISLAGRLAQPGTYPVRVLAAASPGLLAGTSTARSITVRKPRS